MTKGKFFTILVIVSAFLFAIFVWPTRYKDVGSMLDEEGVSRPKRMDRMSRRVEVLGADGEWLEYSAPRVEYDSRDTPAGYAVGKAQQAGDDIRKMNEVAKDAINQGRIDK